MFQHDLPRRRRRDHCSRGERLPVLPEPADRHARRLGVLGHLERRCNVTPVRKTDVKDLGKDRAGFRRVALIALPLTDPGYLESIASAAAHVRVAAA